MAKSNRKCVICGSEYYYCSHSCTDSLGKPSWMASFCSDNCRNIYNATAKYNMKKLTAEEAKEILDNCDLSNKENFVSSTKKLIEEIYEAAPICKVYTAQVGDFNFDEHGNMTEIVEVNEMGVVVKNVDATIPDAMNMTIATSDSPNFLVTTTNTTTKQTNYKKKKRKRKND